MRITEYPKTELLNNTDAFVIDGTRGTKKITTPDLAISLAGALAPEMHSRIFRGKNLGSAVTDEQKAAIKDGSFKDLFLGDYWTINGTIYRIVDMNYWKGTRLIEGNEYTQQVIFNDNHLVIMPDRTIKGVGYAYMNAEDSTVGGYYDSSIRSQHLSDARSIIHQDFPSMVLTHPDTLVNAVDEGGCNVGWTRSNVVVELPNVNMIIGTDLNEQRNPLMYSSTQLALFNIRPEFMFIPGEMYWLRDVVNAEKFAVIADNPEYGAYGVSGMPASMGASLVRPCFCIG